MSFKAIQWALAQDVRRNDRLVLTELANCLNAKTKLCKPSIEYLTRRCGISRRSVFNALDNLTEAGLIERVRIGKGANNRYRLSMQKSEVQDVHLTPKSEVQLVHSEVQLVHSEVQDVHLHRNLEINLEPNLSIYTHLRSTSNVVGDTPKTDSVCVKEREQNKNNPLQGFDEVWLAYPKKGNRPKAEKAWLTIKPDEQLRQTMLSAIAENQKSNRHWRNGFSPFFANWLIDQRWQDEIPTEGKLNETHNGNSNGQHLTGYQKRLARRKADMELAEKHDRGEIVIKGFV